MLLNQLRAPKGSSKNKKRLGRGESSGLGKTSGKGHKGQKARSGGYHKTGFEGGQMPLKRRLPKRGFTNRRFAVKCEIVNLSVLEAKFDAGAEISVEALAKKRIVTGKNRVKLLAKGKVSKNFSVLLENVSSGAAKKIIEAGGICPNQKKAAQEKSEKATPVKESHLAPEHK